MRPVIANNNRKTGIQRGRISLEECDAYCALGQQGEHRVIRRFNQAQWMRQVSDETGNSRQADEIGRRCRWGAKVNKVNLGFDEEKRVINVE